MAKLLSYTLPISQRYLEIQCNCCVLVVCRGNINILFWKKRSPIPFNSSWCCINRVLVGLFKIVTHIKYHKTHSNIYDCSKSPHLATLVLNDSSFYWMSAWQKSYGSLGVSNLSPAVREIKYSVRLHDTSRV